MKHKLTLTPPQTRGMQIVLCTLSLGAALMTEAASPYIWDGGGSDNYWNNAANWGGNLPVPSATSDLEFQGNTRLTSENNFPGSSSFRAITFSPGAGAFSLLGNSVTLAGNVTNNSSSLQTLSLPLSISAARYIATLNGDLTLGGAISGNGGLHIIGSGKTTLTGRSTYTNYTYVNGGMLILPAGGAINNRFNFIIGQNAGQNGALYVNGGTITNLQASTTANFMVGRAGFGSLEFTAGSIRANTVYIGWTGGYGTALINGGSFYCGTGADYMVIGNSSGTGVLTVESGLMSHAGANRAISLDNNALGRGEINVLGGTLDNSGGAISFGLNTALMTVGTGSGIVNINGGSLLLNRFITASQNLTPQEYNSRAYVNFNGGTLMASASALTSPSLAFSSNFIPAHVTIRVNGAFGEFPGGAIIDTADQDCLAQSSFLSPTGEGIRELRIADGGSGYIGAPYVSIIGAGIGATAIANMVDDGTGKGTFKVGSITVCNPGVDYTAIDTVFDLIGGGAQLPAMPDSMTPVVTAPNTSGGLTKNGEGTLTLLGTNNYSGPTLVNSGRLQVTTLHAAPGAVTVNDGATLSVIRIAEQPILSLSSLTLGTTAGAGLEIVLPDGNASSQVIEVGNLNLMGTTKLTIKGANFAVGPKFPVLKYTTLAGDAASLVNGILVPAEGTLATLTHDPVTRTFDLHVTAVSGDLKWSGTISSGGVGLWDVNTTANWLNNGIAKPFIPGANVTMDDTATGVTSASLVGEIDPLAVEVNNSVKNYTISGPGSLVGSMTLTKAGSKSLILSSANLYTGDTFVNGGVLTLSGSLSNSAGNVTVDGGKLTVSGSVATGTGAWKAGATVGNKGSIAIETGANVQLAGSFVLGGTAGIDGAVTISGGTITNIAPAHASNFEIGVAGYGGMQMSGGIGRVNTFYVGGGAGLGVASISGGSFFSGNPGGTEYLLVGGVSGGKGVLTIEGGFLKHSGNRLVSVNNNSDGRGELNLLAGTLDNTGGGIGYGYNSGNGTGTGIVNLNGGTLMLNRFVNLKSGSSTLTGNAYLNLNGATLVASPSTLTSPGLSLSSSFIPARMDVHVNGAFGTFTGGAVIDTAGQNCMVESPLLAPGGNGISALAVADGGSGFIGAPYVSINGDGIGATAIANMVSDGNGALKVGSVTVSNPGINYTAAGTWFSFEGGGPVIPATPGGVTTAPNASGGLTKNGEGILTLAGANTYTGATLVNSGTLRVTGALDAASAVTVAGGSLSGTGVIGGGVTVQDAGSLTPGAGVPGTLTINNTLNLAAASTTLMRVDASAGTHDKVEGVTTLNYGGTLVISNTAGTLTVGQSFQLFSTANRVGNFNSVQGANGGTWTFDPATGMATLTGLVASYPTNITASVNGASLSLSWPETHKGWLAQSNSISLVNPEAWFDIPDSQLGTTLDIQLDSSKPNVFYRLRQP
jgi:fibronectin-binding autotransporter adhesin